MTGRAHRTVLALCITQILLLATAAESKGLFSGGGPKLGWNRSTLIGDRADAANAEPINGYLLGGFVRFGISEGFSLQPEILISRKGAEADTLRTRGTVKLDYVEIPILLRYTIPVRSSFRPTLYAGPAVAFRLHSKVEAERFGRTYVQPINDEVKAIDSSIVLGLEIKLLGDRPALTVEGRYTQSLADIEDADTDLNVRSRVLSVAVGLWFGVKR